MAKKSKLPTTVDSTFNAGMNQPMVVKSSNARYEKEERERKAKYALEDIERAAMHKQGKQLMRDIKKIAKVKVNALSEICDNQKDRDYD